MNLSKKISIGISPDLKLEEYKYIFEKYNNYISEIYSSVPIPFEKIHSRKTLFNKLSQDNTLENKIIDIIKIAKKYGINFELAINSRKDINKSDIKLMYDWCKKNNIKVDKIVTLNNLIEYCYEYFGDIEYCYSYNNNIENIKSIDVMNDLFSEIVIGNKSLRDIKMFKYIKSKNKKIRLLLNNGCSHNCLWCSSNMANYCEKIFENNLKKYSLNFLISIQTVFPFEVKEFYEKLNLVNSYKLSTRSDNYETIINTLETYIKNIDIEKKEQIRYTGKLEYLIKTIEKENIDLYKINKIKSTIWRDCLNENFMCRNK